jgi:hypothetical protein
MLRSKLTNDATLLPGVDRRSRGGRRYQDIVEALAAEYPGANPVALRELATLRFTLEREQGAIVSGGDQRSLEDLIRLTNSVERKERALRVAKRQAKPPSSSVRRTAPSQPSLAVSEPDLSNLSNAELGRLSVLLLEAEESGGPEAARKVAEAVRAREAGEGQP